MCTVSLNINIKKLRKSESINSRETEKSPWYSESCSVLRHVFVIYEFIYSTRAKHCVGSYELWRHAVSISYFMMSTIVLINYPVMILSFCSMLRCRRQRRVRAEPISRVAPVVQSMHKHTCSQRKGNARSEILLQHLDTSLQKRSGAYMRYQVGLPHMSPDDAIITCRSHVYTSVNVIN